MTNQLDHNDPNVHQLNERDLGDRTLVIGNMRRWASEGRLTSSLRDFSFLNFGDLNAETLKEYQPDIILSPLVGDDFDAIEIAQVLSELKFEGRYRVVSDTLPNAGIVKREVAEHADGLDFDVLLMPQDPAEKSLRDVSDLAQNAPHSPDNSKQKASDP